MLRVGKKTALTSSPVVLSCWWCLNFKVMTPWRKEKPFTISLVPHIPAAPVGLAGGAAALDWENEEALCTLQVLQTRRRVKNVPTDGEVWTICTLPDGADQTWADGNPHVKPLSQNRRSSTKSQLCDPSFVLHSDNQSACQSS